MRIIDDFYKLKFHSWNDIQYKKNRISSFFGKTYFYHNKRTGLLSCKNFTIIERILHRYFGYKKEFTRENFWGYLADKKIVSGHCPKKEVFRKIVEDKIKIVSRSKLEFLGRCHDWKVTDDEIISILDKIPDLKILKTKTEQTALFEAANRGRCKVAEYLLNRGEEINSGANKDCGLVATTPLLQALSLQHDQMTQLFLDKGANVDAKDAYGNTALHRAIGNLPKVNPRTVIWYPGDSNDTPKEPKKILKAILDKNPDVNVRNDNSESPFYTACEIGDQEVITWLVHKGADLTGDAKFGKPPLFAAIQKGNLELVKFLFSLGMNLNVSERDKNHDWKTSLRLAAAGIYNSDTKTWEINLDLIKFLADNGCDLNQPSGGLKMSPLHELAANGHSDAIEYLLQKKADPKVKDAWGRTPAEIARIGKHEAIAQLIESKF
jgi:ankyrin repeat protein